MNYADPSDFASNLEQREREAALEIVRNRQQQQALPAIGICHNCEEPLPEGQLFCARMEGELHCCRSDYELRKRNA